MWSLFMAAALNIAGPANAETPKFGSVALILDCSLSMAELAATARVLNPISDPEIPTRMEAAKGLLLKMLRDLAADGKSPVGLWLYGHRIVWEQNVNQPNLLTQDDYLEATVGYAALNGLLPGDDVEQAQPIKRFTEVDFPAVRTRLEVVKPWGEKPLYFAITRALDALATQPAAATNSIIVLTDGGNEQGRSRFTTTLEQAIRGVQRNLVPIHFIHFGPFPPADDPTEQALRDLAERGGGSLVHVGASTRLTIGQVLSNRRKMATSSASPSANADSVEARIAAATALLTQPVDRSVFGSVVYYGKPVSSATVTLEGTGIPPVKTDRLGHFMICKVPSGHSYRILVQAIARNSFREKSLDLNVATDAEEQPPVTIDLK
jgi:hypothetical protein